MQRFPTNGTKKSKRFNSRRSRWKWVSKRRQWKEYIRIDIYMNSCDARLRSNCTPVCPLDHWIKFKHHMSILSYLHFLNFLLWFLPTSWNMRSYQITYHSSSASHVVEWIKMNHRVRAHRPCCNDHKDPISFPLAATKTERSEIHHDSQIQNSCV